MNRERAQKAVIVLVGLLFVAAIYPVTMALLHTSPSDDTGDTMMGSRISRWEFSCYSPRVSRRRIVA